MWQQPIGARTSKTLDHQCLDHNIS
uniref:Uncharacterized protein n=1 Tax=Arundo donax TaxID=35708 RepID=A0A0A8ZZ31_ARUDO